MSKKAIGIILFLLFIILLFRFQQFYNAHPPYRNGQNISIITILQQEPVIENSGQKFTIKTPTNQHISVTADNDPQFHYGQVITVNGQLQQYTFPDGQKLLRLYHPKIVLEREADNPIAAVATMIRSRTEILYNSVLSQTEASLLMGMVFGANEKFSDAFRQALQTTGVLHVIAASGMNVSFVSAALLYSLGLFLQRRTALVFGCLGIIFYVFLVGLQPSILRASIMGLLAFGAGLFGRQYIGFIGLFISGYLLILWQPNFLFDVGFQLSFMATLGIIFLKPLLDRPLEKFGKIGEFGGETVTTTLAAQLGTVPILLGTFGQVGLLSIVVNALVLWTIPIVMICGSLAALFGLFFLPLGQIFLYPVSPLLSYFESVVLFFGKSNLVIHSNPLPVVVWVGYYLLLGAVVLVKKKKK